MKRALKERKIIKLLKERGIKFSEYFISFSVLIYLLLFFISRDLFIESVSSFFNLFLTIVPILFFVFGLMVLTNYFVTSEFILKRIREKGIKRWFFAVTGGILSAGPIYMWYPLLADLKEKGISNGLLACFLYNRSIKIPLIPVMLLYFDWSYIFILLLTMVFVSIIQGILIDKLNLK
jgi:uncharacterized membrane protein YraQ (UPF0718 family)